jgi:hypothetical protein
VYCIFSRLDRFTISLRIFLSRILILLVTLLTLVSLEFLASVSQLEYINLVIIFRSSLNFYRACRYRNRECKGFSIAYIETNTSTTVC